MQAPVDPAGVPPIKKQQSFIARGKPSTLPTATYLEAAGHVSPIRDLQAAAAAADTTIDSPHKPLLPVRARNMAVFVLAFIILALAAAAGMGGGELLVPLLSMLGGFPFLETVALSNAAIFAAAITNLMFNLPRKNPVKPGPIIDYDLLLLFGPPIVIGSVAGSKLNYLVPSYIPKALLLLVLCPMTWRMLIKAKLLWDAETFEAQQEAAAAAAAAVAGDCVLEESGARAWATTTPAAVNTTDAHTSLTKQCGASSVAAPVGRPQLQSSTAGGGPSHSAHIARSASMPLPSHNLSTCLNNPGDQLQATCNAASSTCVAGGGTAAAPPGHRSLQRMVRSLSTSLRHHNSPAVSRARSQMLEPSPHNQAIPSGRPTQVDLLGPGLMLLTDKAAAAAAVHLQHLERIGGSREGHDVSLVCSRTSSYRQQQHQQDDHDAACAPRVGGGEATLPTAKDVGELRVVNSECCIAVAEDVQLYCNALAATPSPYELHHQALLAKLHAMQQHKQQQHQQQQQQRRLRQQQQPPLAPAAARLRCTRLAHDGCLHTPELDAEMSVHLKHHADSQYPKTHMASLLAILLVVAVATIAAHFGLVCGTWQYWLLALSPLPLMVIVWALMRWHVLWRVGWQVHLNIMHPTDIMWTARNSLVYPALCITVGVVAGLLGLGGGAITAPLLLELDVHPSTAAASSQAALLISSCTSSIIYLVSDDVPADYGVAMAILGLLGTAFGQIAINNYIVKRTGRCSLLVFVLTLLFVLAMGAGAAMLGVAVVEVVQDPSRLTATRSSALCITHGDGLKG